MLIIDLLLDNPHSKMIDLVRKQSTRYRKTDRLVGAKKMFGSKRLGFLV